MTGKQITELDSTISVGSTDLILMRSASSGTDKKIKASDFINSVGNPALQGFTATLAPSPAVTTLLVTAINGSKIPAYTTGMKISFISPSNLITNIKIKLDNLAPVNLVDYQTSQSSSLLINDYVEAVYIVDKFHRVNDLKSVQNIYSNEYKTTGVFIKADESYTTVTLASAIGIEKAAYYDGMKISFICYENTKGTTKIAIDELGSVDLIDIVNFVYAPLYANQQVEATYSSTYDAFIRSQYNVQDPTIDPILDIPAPTDQQIADGIIPDPIIPAQNSKAYTVDAVSTGINSFITLKEAVEAILKAFPNAFEQEIRVTITINTTLNVENNLFAIGRDLSWITLRSANNTITIDRKLNKGFIFSMTGFGSKFFSIAAGTTIAIIDSLSYDIECSFINIGKGGNFSLTRVNINSSYLKYFIESTTPAEHEVNISLDECNINLPNAENVMKVKSRKTITLKNVNISACKEDGIFIYNAGSSEFYLTLTKNTNISSSFGKSSIYVDNLTSGKVNIYKSSDSTATVVHNNSHQPPTNWPINSEIKNNSNERVGYYSAL